MASCWDLSKLTCKIITPENLCQNLNQTLDFPVKELYLYGDLPKKIKLAVVGTRKATQKYLDFTFNLCASLARNGICILSGLAYGIDIAAHRGALSSKVPSSTAAVLATPITNIYPSEHIEDVYQILKNCGTVITLKKGSSRTFKSDFIKRNWILALVADAILVTQAPKISGALITAKFGLDLGKDIFAVPGPPWDAACEGTNQLIKDGAHVVTTENDILEYFNLPIIQIHQETPKLSRDEISLLALLKTKDRCFIEDFFAETNLPYEKLISAINSLQAKGIIELSISDEVILKKQI